MRMTSTGGGIDSALGVWGRVSVGEETVDLRPQARLERTHAFECESELHEALNECAVPGARAAGRLLARFRL